VLNASLTCTITAQKAGDDNYLGPVTDGPDAVTLNKATATVNVVWSGGVYTGNPWPASGTVTGVGLPAEVITTPAATFVYYSGTTASGAPLAGAPVDPGFYTVRVGFAGNANYLAAYADKTIVITFNFTGFFQPVDNASTDLLNRVKAGSSIPIKFRLSGYWGLSIFAAGYPRIVTIPCVGISSPIPDSELPTSTANNGLVYDASADQYVYVWKTTSNLAPSCRQFQIKLVDGTEQEANFQFAK
jgi:hypothetical protein